jgi:hypothetical protein
MHCLAMLGFDVARLRLLGSQALCLVVMLGRGCVPVCKQVVHKAADVRIDKLLLQLVLIALGAVQGETYSSS